MEVTNNKEATLISICLIATNSKRSNKIVNLEKIDHRYVLQYFHFKGLSPTDIRAKLDSTLGKFALSFLTIKYWVAEFKLGRTSCHDGYGEENP